MTLSPKMIISNSPLDCRRVRIFRLALLRAFTSRAHTPTRPTVRDFPNASFNQDSTYSGALFNGRLGLLRSLLLGLAVQLATLLPLVCLCCVRLRDRRGALGLANGPEFHESRCLAAALGLLDGCSFNALTGTNHQSTHLQLTRTIPEESRTLMQWLGIGSY